MDAIDTPKPIFISYAHKDNEGRDPKRRWLDRLLDHLQLLVEQNDLTVCSDQDIGIGDDWHAHIQTHLNGAKAAVLLVSSSFLASKYIRSNELPILLKNAKDKGVKILPVIVSPCLFERAKSKYPDPKIGPEEFTLASLQTSNPPEKSLIEMDEGEQERVLVKVAQRLLEIVGQNPLYYVDRSTKRHGRFGPGHDQHLPRCVFKLQRRRPRSGGGDRSLSG
jgi:TIR domain